MPFAFATAAAKHLSSVEINNWNSNQHEFNGVASLRRMFGYNRQYLYANFIFWDNDYIVEDDAVNITWYDARENSLDRTEYRLYYTENSVVKHAQVNDLLVVGQQTDNSIVIMIVRHGSQQYNLFMRLFGMTRVTSRFVICNNIAA